MYSGTLELTRIEHSPNQEVALLTFVLAEGDLDFEEGQFLFLETMEAHVDGKTLKKPYSIASTHNHFLDTKEIQFYVKKAASCHMSCYLVGKIQIGAQLNFSGPLGQLTDDTPSQSYLFISTGSGVAPVLSHMRHLTQEDLRQGKLANIFGEKTMDDLVPSVTGFFANNDAHTQHILFLSRDDAVAPFRKGHVQDGLDEALDFLGTKNIIVFICGMPQMAIDVKQKLVAKGIAEEHIHMEMY